MLEPLDGAEEAGKSLDQGQDERVAFDAAGHLFEERFGFDERADTAAHGVEFGSHLGIAGLDRGEPLVGGGHDDIEAARCRGQPL